jgi:hypothetical protein
MAREITFLKQVVNHVDGQAFAKRCERARRMAGMQVGQDAGPKSAAQIASSLRPDMLESITKTVQAELEDMGIAVKEGVIASRPRQAITCLARPGAQARMCWQSSTKPSRPSDWTR